MRFLKWEWAINNLQSEQGDHMKDETEKLPNGCNTECKKEDSSYHPISCDQVSWLMSIFDRYLPKSAHPSISREREMKQYGMLYEVMEIAKLRFEDDSAMWNGTPNEARREKPKVVGPTYGMGGAGFYGQY